MLESRSFLFVIILFAVLELLLFEQSIVEGSELVVNRTSTNDSSIHERLPTYTNEQASNRKTTQVVNNNIDEISKELKLEYSIIIVKQKHEKFNYDECDNNDYDEECAKMYQKMRDAENNDKNGFYIPGWFLIVTCAVGLIALVTLTMLIRILIFSICFTLRLHSVEGIVIFNGDILEPVENDRLRYTIVHEADYTTRANHMNTTPTSALDNFNNNFIRHNSVCSRNNNNSNNNNGTNTPFISVADALPSYEEEQQLTSSSPSVNVLTSRAARLSLTNMTNNNRSNDVSVVDSTIVSLRREEEEQQLTLSSHAHEPWLNQSPLHLYDRRDNINGVIYTSPLQVTNEICSSHVNVNDAHLSYEQSALIHNNSRTQSHDNVRVLNENMSFTNLDRLQHSDMCETTEMPTLVNEDELHMTHAPYGDEHVVFIYTTPTTLPSLPIPRTSLIFEVPPITEAFQININFRQWFPFLFRRRRSHRNHNSNNSNRDNNNDANRINNHIHSLTVVHRVPDEHVNHSVLRHEEELLEHEHHEREQHQDQHLENYYPEQVNPSFVPTLSSTLPLPLSLPPTRNTSPFYVPPSSSSHAMRNHHEVSSLSMQTTHNDTGNRVSAHNNSERSRHSVLSESSSLSAENVLLSNRVFYSGEINHEWPSTLPPFEMTFPSALEVPVQMKQYIKPEQARRRAIHKKKKYREKFTKLNGEYDGQLFSMWDMPAWSLFNPARLYWYWIFHTSLSNETALGCPIGSAEVNPDEDVIVGPNGELRYRHHPYLRPGSESSSWLEQNLCISAHHQPPPHHCPPSHHNNNNHCCCCENSVWGREEGETGNLHHACTWSYNREMEDLPESHVVSYHAQSSYRNINSTDEYLCNNTTHLKDDAILREYRLAFIPYRPRTPNAPPDYTVIEEDEQDEDNRTCWNENEALMSNSNDRSTDKLSEKSDDDDNNDHYDSSHIHDSSILFTVNSIRHDTPLLNTCNSIESGTSNDSSNTNNISSSNFDVILHDSNDVTSNDNNNNSKCITSNDKHNNNVNSNKNNNNKDDDNIITSILEENETNAGSAWELNAPNNNNNYRVVNRE